LSSSSSFLVSTNDCQSSSTSEDGVKDEIKHSNTLAQTGTSIFTRPPIQLSGTGLIIQDKSVFKGKAKRKYISQKIVTELLTLAQRKGDKELRKQCGTPIIVWTM